MSELWNHLLLKKIWLFSLAPIQIVEKSEEIRNNSQVSLYYSDNEGGSYVVLKGTAHLIDNPEKKGAAMERRVGHTVSGLEG